MLLAGQVLHWSWYFEFSGELLNLHIIRSNNLQNIFVMYEQHCAGDQDSHILGTGPQHF